jgi:hypothetical protein
MGDIYGDDGLASGSRALWLWALLGSLGIHLVLMSAAISWKGPSAPPARKVVPMEAITLTKACPGTSVGGGGQPTAQPCPPASQPVQPAKPKPKPKPEVRRPVPPPEYADLPATPMVPPPPALAIPKPAPQTASVSRSLTSGTTPAAPGRPGRVASTQGGQG